MAHRTYTNAEAVTPSDSTTLRPTEAIYVGAAGDVKVDMYGGSVAHTVTFKSVPSGSWLWIKVNKIYATGTSASQMVALR